MVAAARADAERSLAAARQAAQENALAVAVKTRTEVEHLLAEAEADAEREKAKRIVEATQRLVSEIRMDDATRRALVDGMVCLVRGGNSTKG